MRRFSATPPSRRRRSRRSDQRSSSGPKGRSTYSSPTATSTTSAASRTSTAPRSLPERRRREGSRPAPSSRSSKPQAPSGAFDWRHRRPARRPRSSRRAANSTAGAFRVAAFDAPSHGREGLAFVLPEQGVLLPGDHLSAITYPLLAESPRRAAAACERLIEALDRFELRWVVPGHGPALSAAEARAIAEADLGYLRALEAGRARGGGGGAEPGRRALARFRGRAAAREHRRLRDLRDPRRERPPDARRGRVGSLSASGTFSGRAVIVTGASSGIGRAVSERLAAEGADLCLVAAPQDAKQLERSQASSRRAGRASPSSRPMWASRRPPRGPSSSRSSGSGGSTRSPTTQASATSRRCSRRRSSTSTTSCASTCGACT